MQKESFISKFFFLRSIPNLIVLSLVVSAMLTIIWVAQIAINDIIVWNKDVTSIFFGSRTGEPISLGIGMQLIHYLLVGISILAVGTVFFLRNRMTILTSQQINPNQTQKMKVKIPLKTTKNNETTKINLITNNENGKINEERFFSGCLHHFGYLSSRPKDSPIPQECIICQRLGDCMVATVYVKKSQ
ncbi:hypothetical protein KJN74_00070 [Candidatus Bathyarchaeota archaeon]|nr:hypothetical protein [Candidatus Bathyarchaeota archaeon]